MEKMNKVEFLTQAFVFVLGEYITDKYQIQAYRDRGITLIQKEKSIYSIFIEKDIVKFAEGLNATLSLTTSDNGICINIFR